LGDGGAERIAGRRSGGHGNWQDGDGARARCSGGATGQWLVGVQNEKVQAVDGHGDRVNPRSIDGVLGIDFTVVANDELDNGVVVVIHDIEVGVVGLVVVVVVAGLVVVVVVAGLVVVVAGGELAGGFWRL
jgi:hypothetical protein